MTSRRVLPMHQAVFSKLPVCAFTCRSFEHCINPAAFAEPGDIWANQICSSLCDRLQCAPFCHLAWPLASGTEDLAE